MNPLALLSFGVSTYMSIMKQMATSEWRKHLDASIAGLKDQLTQIEGSLADIETVLEHVEFETKWGEVNRILGFIDRRVDEGANLTNKTTVRDEMADHLEKIADALTGHDPVAGPSPGMNANYLVAWFEACGGADYEKRLQTYVFAVRILRLILGGFRVWHDATTGDAEHENDAQNAFDRWWTRDNPWNFPTILEKCQTVLETLRPAGYGSVIADEISTDESSARSWEFNPGNGYQLVVGKTDADPGKVVVGWAMSIAEADKKIGISIYQGTPNDDGIVEHVERKDAFLAGEAVSIPTDGDIDGSKFYLCTDLAGVPTGHRVNGMALRHQYVKRTGEPTPEGSGMGTTSRPGRTTVECWFYLQIFTWYDGQGYSFPESLGDQQNRPAKAFGGSDWVSGSISPQPVLCGDTQPRNTGTSSPPDYGPWTGKFLPMRDAALCTDADRDHFLRPYAMYDYHLPKLTTPED